jgi:hypothetical protein
MIIKYYKCEFKSDIVLPASSNTQGNIALSDFVAGSNFLGMVAANYGDFQEDSFEVFHSGDVCFGDAHLLVGGKPSYKIPLSFHELKVGDGYFNRLQMSDSDENAMRENQQQLKQMRKGFMNDTFVHASPEYNYSQKSSYDKDLRRSKDSGMFGYSALKKGTNWIFKISYTEEKYIAKVEANLLGEKKLGKSKTAQYGQVFIAPYSDFETLQTQTPNNNLTYIYVNSRLALMDEETNPTLVPSIQNLGLEGGKIVWDKTQIKTSSYTPYNYKRQTKEYTRVCINKGSVIVIENLQGEIKTPIGAYKNEGFGDLIVNPKFLEVKTPELKKEKAPTLQQTSGAYDKNLIAFLQAKQTQESEKFAVAAHVQKVYEKFVGPSKSQWGEIRSIASRATKENLIAQITEYIQDGVAKKQWDEIKEKLFEEIKKSDNSLAFTKLLAMIVSKKTQGSKENDK